LDRGDPGRPFVGYARLAAHAHDHLVVMHTVYQVSQRLGKDGRVSIHLDVASAPSINQRKVIDAPSNRLQRNQA
jgi:hypothetical protein